MLTNWIKSIQSFINHWFRLQNHDINGISYSCVQRIMFYLIGILFTFVICYYTPKGFDDEFIDYIKDVFAIFVGFFITALVFAYDKLPIIKIPSQVEIDKMEANKRPNSKYLLWIKRQNNYTIKFLYSLGFNILSSCFVLFLLTLNVLFPTFFNINMEEYTFVSSFSDIEINSIFTCLYVMLIFFFRWIVIYLIFNVFVYTMYSVTSIIQVLNKKNKHFI